MKRKKGGFTLTETLAVVGILAVVLAVAVPAVITLRGDLKMRELDDTAREIFLAAQNSLTARKAAGVPLQADDTGDDGRCWLSSSDGVMKALLPTGTIESVAAGNHYMIWYNPDSATVLEAYYAERALPEEEIRSCLYSDYDDSSHKAERRQAGIGYYNGSDLEMGNVVSLLPPLLTITNGNELAVSVRVPKAVDYAAAGVTLTVSVDELEQDGNAVPGHQRVFSGDRTAYSPTDGTLARVLTLDSLTEGQRFRDICPDITPGANIRVTATLSGPAGGERAFLSASAYAVTNSLFDSRAAADSKDTLYIACARHLQNLAPAVSNLPDPADGSRNYYAGQTAELTWPDGQKFQPIRNRSLRAYNGNGNQIADLRVDCDNAAKTRFLNGSSDGNSGAGLFAFVERAELSNIRLVNPLLTGTNSGEAEYVGALAGILREATVSNCQAYAAGDAAGAAGIDCGGHAGGLIGLAVDSYTITGSSASLPRIRSRLQNAYLGGLVAYASVHETFTGSVSKCYADTGWMGNDGKWNAYYGIRGTSATVGGLFGGVRTTRGTSVISDCYALGWSSGGSGGSLIGKTEGVRMVSNCYSILQSRDGNQYYVNERPIASLSRLEELRWSGWSAGGSATAYHPAVCGENYPYPMLGLRHYGDWPVQTVDEIRLFDGDTAASGEMRFIMAPVSDGTAEFYAEARSGGASGMEPVSAVGRGDGITVAETEYDGGTGRTRVTLTFPKNTPRVTCVDLAADEYTLRAVVLLYDATVTLTGENDKDGSTAESVASTESGKNRVDTLTLRANAKTGAFTAAMAVAPGREEIVTAVANWQAGTGDQFGVSAAETDFAGWERVRSGDPAVTANGNPDAGSNILAPDATGSYYPKAGENGELTVAGAASGTATVSARWAMDESLEAECEVKMEGARALIETAAATGATDRTLGEKGNYPYRLDLTAEPGETITLKFTPRLFGGQTGANGTYTWQIRGTGGTSFLSEPDTRPQGEDGGVWTCALKDDSPRATYTVTLTYANGEEKSVDYMTFTVYRAAGRGMSDYQGIVLQNRDAGTVISGSAAGQVEQITSRDYPAANRVTLEGYVSGAENTRVRWLADITGQGDWEPVTGVVGSQSVRDAQGEARATVEWVPADMTSVGTVQTPTGGSIRVTGLDVNEYGEAFAVKLKAEAMEAVGAGDSPSYRTVTVKVMPKLEITPKAKTVVDYRWNKPTVRFQANREVGTYPFIWKEEIDGKVMEITDEGAATQQIDGVDDTTVTVICNYGPFTATATLTWLWMIDDLAAPINADYIIPGNTAAKNTEYFIVEKGETRELELTWGCPISYDIRNTPSSTERVGIIKHSGSDTTSGWNTVGHRTYKVTGNEYTGDNVEALTWVIGGLTSLTRWSFPKYFAVVGMEIDEPAGVDRDAHGNLLLEKDQTVQLTAATSFARELWEEGAAPTLTWKSDHPELVSVDENTGTVTAVKNGAATYSATITATYTVKCKNKKTYTFHDYVTVKVQPKGTMAVSLLPCAADDVAALNAAFPDAHLTDSSVLVPTDGEKWTLIRDGAFAMDTLYLKATASLDGEVLTDLTDYVSNVYGDAFYLDIEQPPEAFYADHPERRGTLYIRVKAKEANAGVTPVEITAELGTASDRREIYLYDTPAVKLTRDGVEVTNGSVPVYLDEGSLSVTLTAKLEPALHSYGDNSETPLDGIDWALQAPAGYDAERYLETEIDGNTITVKLKLDHMPDFRVVLHARSKRGGADSGADAGYALVFLPEEKGQP